MNQPTDPTPEEIRQRCLEIQAGWTPEQRSSRMRADMREPEFNQTPLQPVSVTTGRREAVE